jgi:dienelactone hydrolase
MPKDAGPPPYQAVMYCAGANMRFARNPDEVMSRLTEWIVKSGRVLVLPAYSGTLERGPTKVRELPGIERDLGIQSIKDARRSIDYLQTRPDIDTNKLAFVGVSLGSGLGLKVVATEPRFKAAVFLSLGYSPEGALPVVDSWNYAPRLKVPVLMMDGEDDSGNPVETAQKPMFKALGTPEKDKKYISYQGGHVDFINNKEVIQEALKWLDTYLGPVKQH